VTRSAISVRLIDPLGHRFGGALSVVLLAVATVLDLPILVAAVALALGVSALFGTQYSILGRPWPTIRRVLELGPPANPEPEFGPRFAQALGFIGLALGVVLLVAGVRPIGWLPVIGVAALQTLLAATGYCLGCKLYLLHWWVPDAFDRIIGRRTAEAE
jgi:Domain of unknown function (DUF4395)